MNEIERVISYIRSCREANIDVTITIDKDRSHLILNALEKSVSKHPRKIRWTKFAGCMRPNFKSGICPCCNADVDTDSDPKVCGECGQFLKC